MPKCFKCERAMDSALAKKTTGNIWDCPGSGVNFTGGGSYGSGLYDRLIDGVYVQLLVCDGCLKKHKKLLRIRKDKKGLTNGVHRRIP
jgi:hypothetical protein